MRTVKKKVLTHVVTKVLSIQCDICKKTHPGSNWGSGNNGDTQVFYEYEDPDLKEIMYVSFDICPTCFIERLVPALKELGAEPTIEKE